MGLGLGIGLLNIVCAVICYFLAEKKGRDPILWAVVGLVLSIIGPIILLVLEEERRVRGGQDEDRY